MHFRHGGFDMNTVTSALPSPPARLAIGIGFAVAVAAVVTALWLRSDSLADEQYGDVILLERVQGDPAVPIPEFQRAIIADGRVTVEEAAEARERTVVCLREAGLSPIAGETILSYHLAPISASERDPEGVRAVSEACQAQHLDYVMTAYAIQDTPYIHPAAREKAISECLAAKGIAASPPLRDDIERLMQDESKRDSVVFCTNEGWSEFAPD